MNPAEAIRAGKAVGGWLLRHWWIAALIGLAIALHLTRGALAEARRETAAERTARKSEHEAAANMLAQTEARWTVTTLRAVNGWTTRILDRQPIILRSTDTVRTYAQTPAGRVSCHDADRVRGIDALDAALFPKAPGPAPSGADTVPADPG